MNKLAIVTIENVDAKNGDYDYFNVSGIPKNITRVEKLRRLAAEFDEFHLCTVDEKVFSEYEYVALCSNVNVLPYVDFTNKMIYPEKLICFSVTKSSQNLFEQFNGKSIYLNANRIHESTAENCYFNMDLVIVKSRDLDYLMTNFLDFVCNLKNKKENRKIMSTDKLFNLYVASLSRPTIFCHEEVLGKSRNTRQMPSFSKRVLRLLKRKFGFKK